MTDESRPERVWNALLTPLAVMIGAASMIVDENGPLAKETRRELGQMLLEGSERLDRIARDLLDIARLESGDLRTKKEWEVVEEVVGAALNGAESKLARRDVTIRVPADLLAPFDAVLIQRVLVNLLDNAGKYTPDNAPIEVNVSQVDGEVVFELVDGGPGVPAGEEARVFEKFQRGTGEGIRTGLAICRAIVVAHGGRIWVRNRPGGGAAFMFALPVEGEPPREQVPDLPFSEGPPLANGA